MSEPSITLDEIDLRETSVRVKLPEWYSLLAPIFAAARRGIEADIKPCCGLWDECTERCVPRANAWKQRAETAEAEIAEINKTYIALSASLVKERKHAETAEAERYVPGVWRCAKCQLRLVSTILNAADGNMYADTKPQDCANGCGPMWRISERDERKEAQALFNAEFDKRRAAEAALAEAVRREREACLMVVAQIREEAVDEGGEQRELDTLDDVAGAIRARDQRGPAAQEASSSSSSECNQFNHQGNKNEQR